MHATDFYASTCRCVMQSDPNDPQTLMELRRLLPCLRQALGCYVCFNLLKDPMGPDHNVCRHSVCHSCLGGKMRLKPSCSWCKDHWEFVPNPLLKVLVTCFKKLCIYIYNSYLGSVIRNSSVNGETNHLVQLLQEGMDFQDDYSYKPTTITHEEPPPIETETSMTTSSQNSSDPTREITDAVEISDRDITIDNEDPVIKETPVESSSDVKETVVQFDKNKSSMKNVQRKKLKRIPKFGKKTKNSSKAHDHNYETKNFQQGLAKPVVFLQRAAVRKNSSQSSLLKRSLSKHCAKKYNRKGLKKFNLRNSGIDAPSDLERMDKKSPALKKGKKDLLPPELKPLSTCNCGKSGNFNQLTCIGQRCPCYSMKLPCVSCKCRGCRNPKKGPDYQGTYNISSAAVLRSGIRNAPES